MIPLSPSVPPHSQIHHTCQSLRWMVSRRLRASRVRPRAGAGLSRAPPAPQGGDSPDGRFASPWVSGRAAQLGLGEVHQREPKSCLKLDLNLNRSSKGCGRETCVSLLAQSLNRSQGFILRTHPQLVSVSLIFLYFYLVKKKNFFFS